MPEDKSLIPLLDAGLVRGWEQDMRRHLLGHQVRPPNQIPAVARQTVTEFGPDLLRGSAQQAPQRWLQTSHSRFLDWVRRQRIGTFVLDYRLVLEDMTLQLTMRAVQLFTARWRHQQRGTEYLSLGVAMLQSGRPVFEGERLMVYVDPVSGQLWARPESEFRDGRFTEVS